MLYEMTINVIKPSNAKRTVFARKSVPFKFDPNMGYRKVKSSRGCIASFLPHYCVPNSNPLLV